MCGVEKMSLNLSNGDCSFETILPLRGLAPSPTFQQGGQFPERKQCKKISTINSFAKN